jgi:hypothetical protein
MRSRIRTVLHVLIGTGTAATVIGTLLNPPHRFRPYLPSLLHRVTDCPGFIAANGYCYVSDWPKAAALVLAWLAFSAWAWWMVTLVFRPRQQGDEKG